MSTFIMKLAIIGSIVGLIVLIIGIVMWSIGVFVYKFEYKKLSNLLKKNEEDK